MELNDRASNAFSYQDYASKPSIHGVEVVELRRFNDDGGNMTELGRLADGTHAQLPGFVVKQINYSEMNPGAGKAFPLHHRQTDVWSVPPGGPVETFNTTIEDAAGDPSSATLSITVSDNPSPTSLLARPSMPTATARSTTSGSPPTRH